MEDLEDHSATDAPSVEVYSTLMKKSWKNITFLITNFGKITPSLLLKAVFISYFLDANKKLVNDCYFILVASSAIKSWIKTYTVHIFGSI